jgi:hypothetical protein
MRLHTSFMEKQRHDPFQAWRNKLGTLIEQFIRSVSSNQEFIGTIPVAFALFLAFLEVLNLSSGYYAVPIIVYR